MTANTVRTRLTAATASGRREGWMKHVTSVDTSKTNGYAFAGDFIPSGREIDLPVGAVILSVEPRGSVKNGWKGAAVHRLGADGELTKLTDGVLDWRDDFLTIRDKVVKAIGTQEVVREDLFVGISDADILAEARRRGLA